MRLSRAVVLLAVLIASATACGSASASKPCWQKVQDDWTANTLGSHTYAPACYDQAIKKLPDDLFYYSNAPDAIRSAKQDALRSKEKSRKIAGVTPGSSGDDPGDGGNGSSPGDGGTDSAAGPLGTFMNAGSTSADGMPLPLLILGGVAALLIALGAFGVAS